MTFDIKNTPFSYRGSYIALSYFEENYRYQNNPKGVFFRSIHGDSKNGYMCRILPIVDNAETEYKVMAKPEELIFSTNFGEIHLCFANENSLLITSTGEKLGVKLDSIAGQYKYHYTHPFNDVDIINCMSLCTQYVLTVLKGEKNVSQQWNLVTSESCEIYINPQNGLLAYIEEIADPSTFVKKNYTYENCKNACKKNFDEYYQSMPKVPEKYETQRELAAYVNWSSTVAKSGHFKREAMLMSKNWMTNVWSWDHCFNALALSHNMPKEAFDQFIIMFDHQSEIGKIPDHLNDKLFTIGYCKPPIHGWAISQILEENEYSFKNLTEIYDKMSKWTYWWLNYRMTENGVCEYFHGNDSGWDNSTVFKELPPVQSPDLATFLTIQTQVLSELALKLNKKFEAKQWENTSNELLNSMINYLFENDLPVAKLSYSNKIVENNSLLTYMPILLGNRLPEKYRKNIINVLKSEKFLTNFGLATESPSSPDYIPDGYWQGPIWAPSSMLIIDGLYKSGETEFANKLSLKFCELIKKGGFAENFDAIKGEGLRDRAYTWTSSVFLLLANGLTDNDN